MIEDSEESRKAASALNEVIKHFEIKPMPINLNEFRERIEAEINKAIIGKR